MDYTKYVILNQDLIITGIWKGDFEGLLWIICVGFHNECHNNNTCQGPFLYKKLYKYLLKKVMCVAMLFQWAQQTLLFKKNNRCVRSENIHKRN